jgi:hypothetical protein
MLRGRPSPRSFDRLRITFSRVRERGRGVRAAERTVVAAQSDRSWVRTLEMRARESDGPPLPRFLRESIVDDPSDRDGRSE